MTQKAKSTRSAETTEAARPATIARLHQSIRRFYGLTWPAPLAAPESGHELRTTAASSQRGALASLLLTAFPVELLLRKRGGPLEERCPDAERGRADRIVDEVADKSFDAWAFEHEDHGLLREKDAVPPKASQREPVWRALGEDLSCSLARAWQERGNDRHALIHVTVINARRSLLPTEQPRHDFPEQLARRADPVVECRRQTCSTR
jgi:hypothetical protein